MANTSLEEKLLSTATAGNLSALTDIVGHMTIKERESISPEVYDRVLHSISYHGNDPVEQAYTTMMFLRHVGRYISPAAVSGTLQRRATDVKIQATG